VSPRYLLDTNVLSEPVRPAPDGNVLERFREHSDEIATAAVVWHELQFGVRRLSESGRRRILQRYLEKVVVATVPILPYDAEAAAWHAAWPARSAVRTKCAGRGCSSPVGPAITWNIEGGG
jgi:tRNA(fMet)-specific endonuclease VapC